MCCDFFCSVTHYPSDLKWDLELCAEAGYGFEGNLGHLNYRVMYVSPPCIDCIGEKEVIAPKLDTCVCGYECGPHLSPVFV